MISPLSNLSIKIFGIYFFNLFMLQIIISESVSKINNLLDSISKESKKIITTSSREIIVSGKNKVFDYSETGDVKNIKIMLDLLEQENIIAEILSETIKENDINIMIGSENPIVEMKDCSIITVNYKINSTPAGKIGILGPKRMPYKRVISIVNYVAETIENNLNSKEE